MLIMHNGQIIYTNTDELYHYGVPGMKWGVRRASRLQRKADRARTSASEYDSIAAKAAAKGRTRRAEKYSKMASDDRASAAKYQAKADKKVEKRFAKAGRAAGKADYYKERAEQQYKKHDANARVLDKTAAKLEKQGKYFGAEAARKSAAALRARGMNLRDSDLRAADAYMRRSDKLNQKAKDFSSTTRVNLGKNKVDSIFKSSRQKGYNTAKSNEDFKREQYLQEHLGDRGYAAYNYARGKS